MSDAVLAGKHPPKKQKGSAENNFNDTFKPKTSHVNFGALKNEKAKTDKKKKGKAPKKAIIVFLAVILALGGVGAGLYFTGFLTPVLELVGLAEPAAEAQPTLEEREALLVIREKALSDREAALGKREEQLAAKEAEMQELEENLPESDQSFQEMLQSLSDEKLKDLKRVSSIYSKMDPGEAAGIMGSMYDLMEISAIIYYMQPAASALVLEQMEAGIAADVTGRMLR